MCSCSIYSRERSLKILPWHPYAPVYISSTFTSLHPSHSTWNTWQDSHFSPGVTNYIHYMPARLILHLKNGTVVVLRVVSDATIFDIHWMFCLGIDTSNNTMLLTTMIHRKNIILETTTVCHFFVSKYNVIGKSSAVHWPAHQKSSKLLHNYPVGEKNHYINE